MAMYCASLAKLIFEAGHELLESRNEGFSLARLSFCAPVCVFAESTISNESVYH